MNDKRNDITVIPDLNENLTKPKTTFGIYTKGSLWFCPQPAFQNNSLEIPHQARDDKRI